MTTCYDLIEVKLKHETMLARPVAWNREIADGFGNDSSGNPVKATEFHGTCPYCGNLVHFTSDDIFKDENAKDNVKCLTCGSGNKAIEELKVEAKASGNSPFVDPIAEGVFGLEVNSELLEKLDSTESS